MNFIEILKPYISTEDNITKINDILADVKDCDVNMVKFVLDMLKMYKMDENSFIASVLYLTKPKSEIDYDQIKESFNNDVAKLLQNLNSVGFQKNATNQEELQNIRNMIMGMAEDVRVLIILLSYNLYRMENLDTMPKSEQPIFVKSVRDIYAPLSARLGLREIKNRMEDDCFKFFEPDVYEQLSNEEVLNKNERSKQINLCIEKIETCLKSIGVKGKVYGREKHLASVYNKMKNKDVTLSQIYDLMAVRVLVDTVDECYQILGKITSVFTCIPNRFKDYIASPKPNGYKSIHLGVLSNNNRPIEVQIRTHEMHHYNEYGIAAHWIYKDKGHKASEFDKSINWLKEIIDDSKDLTSKEFVEAIKTGIVTSEIFAQTPNGKVIKFPKGANCIDFAYAVHSSIGNRCVGAKINGAMVPLTTELNNGDVCEILLGANNKGPSRDWLKVVKTSSARSKINSYFKKEFVELNSKNGKTLLENCAKANGYTLPQVINSPKLKSMFKKYGAQTPDEFYAFIGNGTVTSESVVNKAFPKEEKKEVKLHKQETKKRNGVLVAGQYGMLTKFGKCCFPLPGDEIMGFVSYGKGVVVHRKDCVNLQNLDQNRMIEVSWDKENVGEFNAKISVVYAVEDMSLSNLFNLLEKMNIKITSFGKNKQNPKEVICDIIVKDNKEITKCMQKIKELSQVETVSRL